MNFLIIDHRKIQIWSRDAILQYTSEPINGLEHLIAWKPSGSLIASSQMTPNKHLVVFLEKNGLQHGQFELPFPPNAFKLDALSWSHDSQLLLVFGTVIQTSSQVLMLWRQTNYKWDLKQTIAFGSNMICGTLWDPIDATLLHLVSDRKYYQYRWNWLVDGVAGIVALVDGHRAKITHFQRAVIPPPYFSYSFDFETQIKEISFSSNGFALSLIDDTILLFSKTQKKSVTHPFSIAYDNGDQSDCQNDIFNCYFSGKCKDISDLNVLSFTDSGLLYGFQSKQLYEFDYRTEPTRLCKLLNIECNPVAISPSTDVIAIVSDEGLLFKVNRTNKTLTEWVDINGRVVKFPPQCSEVKIIGINDDIHVIGLTENLTLCLDNEVISQNNCNSFTIFDNRFILFTTSDHLLHCWPIDGRLLTPNNYYKEFKPRTVERGSKIITTTSDGKLVLQMPRGNLEAIHPRPLLLDCITRKLDRLEWTSAFDLVRRHRINLNVLYDYKPDLLVTNVGLFIEQIGSKSVDWICLFINDLSNDNFYDKTCEPNRSKSKFVSKTKEQSKCKVDYLCDLMRQTMEANRLKYLNPILLTYIKKSISETVNALKVIHAIEDQTIRDNAIKFLLYYVDINALFDEAFGSYDFDIFLMIASKSQRDPKEYLTLLEELKQIKTQEYMFYKIDVYLKRYKKALNHLSKCENNFEECVDFIKQHSLYRHSVDLFESSDSNKKRKIWKLYAEYLFDKKYFEESAIAYRKCGDIANAVKAYHLSGNWNAAIDSALECPQAVNVENVVRNAAKHLSLTGKHFEASYVLQIYANDTDEAIRSLIDGHLWDHSLRLISTTGSSNLLDHLRSELIKDYESVVGLTASYCDALLGHINRLQSVADKQRESASDSKNYINFDDKSDIYSETNSVSDSQQSSSNSSLSSLATKKSRKPNKKSVSKKYILKVGSSDEDIQLIYAMSELIRKTDGMQEEVSLLIRTLYNLDYVNEAKRLQNGFGHLLEVSADIIEEIWSENKSEESNKYRTNGNHYRDC